MSDFDKEKERERLREKYEHEQQKRESAEKMSELLLQGATMTNSHCSECGDPVFRYDGQEFCATCERPIDRGGDEGETGDDATDSTGEASDSPDDADGQNPEPETIEVTSPSDDARVQFGADREAGADDAPADATNQTAETDRAEPETRPEPGTDESETPSSDQPASESGEATLSGARTSLVRTLSRFSRRAERCEDPQRAREHLAAASEAAEALATLRR
jgi:uncharacterized Zn finger protein (UPF0148 family)